MRRTLTTKGLTKLSNHYKFEEIKQDMKNQRIMIYLEDKSMYLMELNYNFDKYTIKNGCLYLKRRKLGKIVKIKEEL